jgi:hypothetical protein
VKSREQRWPRIFSSSFWPKKTSELTSLKGFAAASSPRWASGINPCSTNTRTKYSACRSINVC